MKLYKFNIILIKKNIFISFFFQISIMIVYKKVPDELCWIFSNSLMDFFAENQVTDITVLSALHLPVESSDEKKVFFAHLNKVNTLLLNFSMFHAEWKIKDDKNLWHIIFRSIRKESKMKKLKDAIDKTLQQKNSLSWNEKKL